MTEPLLFVYDLETGGLDPKVNGIHQISGYIARGREVLEKFNFRCRPPENKVMEKQALDISRTTPEQLADFPSYAVVFQQLLDLMAKYVNPYDKQNKFFELGYNNASFDSPFLRQFWLDNGNKFFGAWFWGDVIDARVLAANELRHVRASMPNFKLATVARQFGIEVDESKLHDAMYDIELTFEVYNVIQDMHLPMIDGEIPVDSIYNMCIAAGNDKAAELIDRNRENLGRPMYLLESKELNDGPNIIEAIKDWAQTGNVLIINTF